MKNINLYFIRHGETEWNLKNWMQGIQDSPLTDKGISGAKITGRSLSNIPFLKAYSSDLTRAVHTRDYIVEQLTNSPDVDIHKGLREMDFGIWEGVSIDELHQDKEFHHYMNVPASYNHSLVQGEGFMDVLTRTQQALDEIVASVSAQDSNILIVTHGTLLRLLLCVINGGDWHKHRTQEYFPKPFNTSISLVNYQKSPEQEKGTYSLVYYNDVSHLSNTGN
ncbi:histidine phosphatase family protein [Zophobihabitans entericus]|uniref:Histidine phosphatase family protein n=1 Tax=Zophobihabitans entericus TaxID=1635327 RepID=A0A6G9IEG3_9GAMM|nr:histidine phosphatase family protein [Zophobihabitans entericus]QIQ22199.1 histidine phosphatase family protein [Zophobihabitans entericus]